MRPGPPTIRLLLVASTLVACGANGRDGADAEKQAAPPTAVAVPSVPSPPAGTPVSITGSWFVLAQDLPYRGLRMTLQDSTTDGTWEGSWFSFDWRSSESEAYLARPSRRVEIEARRDPAEKKRLVVTGPAPQIDETGLPSGGKGRWELTLERASLPGEELRFSGTLVNPAYTPEGGVPVVVVSRLPPWSP